MERTTVNDAKKLFGKNFIGPSELKPLFQQLRISTKIINIPEIHYSLDILKGYVSDYILILGVMEVDGIKLSIRTLRSQFGINPETTEPCFYNQDWYLQENFIDKSLENRWYLLRKQVLEDTRKMQPEKITEKGLLLPSAILCAYTFFANYFLNNELLWYHDFIWCNDTDHNGDRIYVGKYNDIEGINKNGFSIHRHLALRDCYGSSDFL